MAGKNELQELSDYIRDQMNQRGIDRFKLAEIANVSPTQIWRLISKLVRNPKVDTLEKIANAFEEEPSILKGIVYPNRINPNRINNADISVEKRISFFSIKENVFGRGDELSKLIEYTDRAKLIFITGMVGVGKSKLAKALEEHLSEKFTDIIFFSDLQMPITEIIEMIKEDRYLIVLDNLDYESHGGSCIPMLEKIAETKHQSCVIVTCRDLPKEWKSWEPRPKHLKLEGLAEDNAIALLQNQGLPTQADMQLVKDLIKRCDGNPLLLKFTLQDILELYNGDLAYYLNHSTVISGQFSELIEGIVKRLSALELELLYWLALKHETVPFPEIRETFIDRYTTLIDKNKIAEAIKELIRRSLLQTNEEGEFGLQTVVQRWVAKNLFLQLHGEIKAIAANNINKLRWLRSLDLVDEQIKLCDRFSRYEHILIAALTQLESQSKVQSVDAIGYAIANLRYLLGKPIE